MSTETQRGEQTRALIVDCALRLFGELGYEKTTMRAIASAAGVSVGNAYYYFSSKEALVQEFYLRIQRGHITAAEEILSKGGTFSEQLIGILQAGLTMWKPYHEFAGKFIGLAAVPGSPISPFSSDSAQAREMALDIFDRLVAQTTLKMDAEVRAELPELLWLGQLALVVYWVHDDSPEQRQTAELVETAVPYMERLVGASRMKILRPLTNQGLALIRLIKRTPALSIR